MFFLLPKNLGLQDFENLKKIGKRKERRKEGREIVKNKFQGSSDQRFGRL